MSTSPFQAKSSHFGNFLNIPISLFWTGKNLTGNRPFLAILTFTCGELSFTTHKKMSTTITTPHAQNIFTLTLHSLRYLLNQMATYETYETEEDYDTMAEPNVNEATPTVRLKISFPYCFFFNLCSFLSNLYVFRLQKPLPQR